MDKRVEIHSTSRADMNGKRGVATDFHWHEDETKWRYTVELDSGVVVKVRLPHVRKYCPTHSGASGMAIALYPHSLSRVQR